MVHPAAGSIFPRWTVDALLVVNIKELGIVDTLALVVTAGDVVVVPVVVTAVRPALINQGPALGLGEGLGLEQLARVALRAVLSSHGSHCQDQQQQTDNLQTNAHTYRGIRG